jgi:metal-responsive CopG/Arc/MetJ family transcriptional regulator
MKTAISVPDELFESVTRWVSTLHMSRSEFFTVAARRYIDDLAAQSLTEQINAAVVLAAGDDSNAAAARHARSVLATDGDTW